MKYLTIVLFLSLTFFMKGQKVIPMDTAHWEINALAYLIENIDGYNSIYLQAGIAVLKDEEFQNGTIEFDVLMKDRQCFPGIRFRAFDQNNMESFYLRPHQSGNPDANQAAPVINGLTAWQLYFGPTYSFPYEYKLDEWTHVKLEVKDELACIYLDDADKPQFTWKLKHGIKTGQIAIGGGGNACHFANFTITHNEPEIAPLPSKEASTIEGLILKWEISDRFSELELKESGNIQNIVSSRKWLGHIETEENNAANISWLADRPSPDKNTVFARLIIESTDDQLKELDFGYSDRVVVYLNNKPIYRGNNGFRTRDYRYLGTIGLFDSVFLHLKKGRNTLLLAVSESFGGWGVTGRISDRSGLNIR